MKTLAMGNYPAIERFFNYNIRRAGENSRQAVCSSLEMRPVRFERIVEESFPTPEPARTSIPVFSTFLKLLGQ